MTSLSSRASLFACEIVATPSFSRIYENAPEPVSIFDVLPNRLGGKYGTKTKHFAIDTQNAHVAINTLLCVRRLCCFK